HNAIRTSTQPIGILNSPSDRFAIAVRASIARRGNAGLLGRFGMRLKTIFLAGTILTAATPAFAAQDEAAPTAATTDQPTAPVAAEEVQPGDQDIVVTARKREETLLNVPVAVTAVSGDTIQRRGFQQIKDIAQVTPSLNTNSDSVGRVFIAIRGIGTTLVGTVQPGVGIFVDGVYQPNTAYLNNPLGDVERVEV